jgi:hypothetical protein
MNHEASEKHALAVKRTSTGRNVQMRRKEAEADDEIKKLSCTLGTERGVALEVEAEFVKTMKANKQLIAGCERKDARYASASASAATNSQHMGKLQKKVESQQLQIAQYRSCEVVVGDGVAQPGATQAEMASLAVQVGRLGSVMLTKADLTKVTQDLCDEVAERQKGVSARHSADFLVLGVDEAGECGVG